MATNVPPPLVLQKNAAVYQVLYPTNYPGFTLQLSTNLSANAWADLATGTNRVQLSPQSGAGFFRLKKTQ